MNHGNDTTWDSATAEWYASKYGDYPTTQLGIDAIELSGAVTVVDIGCGTGNTLRHAAKQIPNGKLIGVDPVPRMIELAREQTARSGCTSNIRFVEGTAESIPLENNSADWVFAFDSFDHWRDHAQGLAEVKRLLTDTGHFVIVKDAGAPSELGTPKQCTEKLIATGFNVLREEVIQQGDIAFTLWVCNIE